MRHARDTPPNLFPTVHCSVILGTRNNHHQHQDQGVEMAPQVRPAGTETFGLPESAACLIAKLRVMDPALRASILTTKETGK